ncbi:hypothetical protein M885DRAFT_591711, partial [Pelagophyceae sp. CCMP2097]
MHFEVEKSATSELVELGGKSVQLLKKPHADEYKAVRRRIYMIDYDMRAAHKPPGGLRCPRCGSTALKVMKMTHQMGDRSGLKPCLLSDGNVDWLSGKMRECQNCRRLGKKCALYDYDGGMLAQMTLSVQLEHPSRPIQAFGRLFFDRGLEDSINIDPLKNQACATLLTKVVEFGAQSHDEKGSAYEQLVEIYIAELESLVSDEAWSVTSAKDKAVLQSRRNDYELLGSRPFQPWPPWSEVSVGVDPSTVRSRRVVSAKGREGTVRRAVLSVGGNTGADDMTFHAGPKIGMTSLQVICNEHGEIANLVGLRSHGKFSERAPAIEQFANRPHVDLKAFFTDDCPNNKDKIEWITGAPNSGDKRHTMGRSLSFASHFGSLYPRVAHMTKMAFSGPHDKSVDLVDTLLEQGKIHVKLRGKQSMGRQRKEDKFSKAEIALAKVVTFDEVTGAKQGSDYMDRFAPTCIPMKTHTTAVIIAKVENMAKVIRELQETREADCNLTTRQKAKTVHRAWYDALARYDETAKYLATETDPWRTDGLDTRCKTGELPLWRSGDGTNLVEAANLCIDSWACSNGLGLRYGVGLYSDGIVRYNDDRRRKARTETNFVHHDRDLAEARNERSLRIWGEPVYRNLLCLVPDDPAVVIVAKVPSSERHKSEMDHVATVKRVALEVGALRRAKKMPAQLVATLSRAQTSKGVATHDDDDTLASLLLQDSAWSPPPLQVDVGKLVASTEFDVHRHFASRTKEVAL